MLDNTIVKRYYIDIETENNTGENDMLQIKVLEVQVVGDDSEPYSFTAYEFKNGLIAVLGETTNDWYFENRDKIEACGCDIVTGVTETGEIIEWSEETLIESIKGSIMEFGEDSVPLIYKEIVS